MASALTALAIQTAVIAVIDSPQCKIKNTYLLVYIDKQNWVGISAVMLFTFYCHLDSPHDVWQAITWKHDMSYTKLEVHNILQCHQRRINQSIKPARATASINNRQNNRQTYSVITLLSTPHRRHNKDSRLYPMCNVETDGDLHKHADCSTFHHVLTMS